LEEEDSFDEDDSLDEVAGALLVSEPFDSEAFESDAFESEPPSDFESDFDSDFSPEGGWPVLPP
jgi:hypothetical protein